MKETNEKIKDALYEMKVDLGIDTDDIVVGSKLYFLLNDIWNEGFESGKEAGQVEGWTKALARFENRELG
jgi:hypothetical protein